MYYQKSDAKMYSERFLKNNVKIIKASKSTRVLKYALMLLFLTILIFMLTGCRLMQEIIDGTNEDVPQHTQITPNTPDNLDEGSYTATSSQPDDIATETGEMISIVIDEGIQAIDKQYADSDGYIPEDQVDDVIRDVLAYAETQKEMGNVTYYEEGTNSVYMELSDDTGYAYIPWISGTMSGGQDLRIVTIEPYDRSWPEKYQKYADYTDLAAKLTSGFSEYYSFESNNTSHDDDYNASDIKLDVIKQLTDYSIIIWHGHGTFFPKTGPVLCTNIAYTDVYFDNMSDFSKKRLLNSNKNTVTITKEYFEFYLKDNSLNGSLIYLETCSSGEDNQLADVLLSKGAAVVIANSGTVDLVYGSEMMRSIIGGLNVPDNTVAEALQQAEKEHGGSDPNHPLTSVLIFGNNDYILKYPKIDLDGNILTGYFTYKGNSNLYEFKIEFEQVDNKISGTIYDQFNTATFAGNIEGAYINFIKTYNQASGAEQAPLPSIQYSGEIKSDKLIEGEWYIIGEDTSGYFSIFLE